MTPPNRATYQRFPADWTFDKGHIQPMTEQNSHGNRRRRLLIFTAVLLVGIVAVKHARFPRTEFPPQLIGTWETTDERYANRSLEIDAISINFGTGPGTVSTWFIEKIHARADQGGTLYTISYVVHDLHEQVSLIYQDADGEPTIRFMNRPGVVWQKVQGR